MTIIPATLKDLPTIHSLAYAIWPSAYGKILSQQQLEYMLTKFYSVESIGESMNNGKLYFLAIINELPVGFLAIEHQFKNEPVTRIHRIYVLPETQGSGVGKQLVDFTVVQATAAKSQKISLNVNRHNIAQGFYQKLGFFKVAEENIDIGNGYFMEDYTMEKPL